MNNCYCCENSDYNRSRSRGSVLFCWNSMISLYVLLPKSIQTTGWHSRELLFSSDVILYTCKCKATGKNSLENSTWSESRSSVVRLQYKRNASSQLCLGASGNTQCYVLGRSLLKAWLKQKITCLHVKKVILGQTFKCWSRTNWVTVWRKLTFQTFRA